MYLRMAGQNNAAGTQMKIKRTRYAAEEGPRKDEKLREIPKTQ
jgi:hypothetical protein